MQKSQCGRIYNFLHAKNYIVEVYPFRSLSSCVVLFLFSLYIFCVWFYYTFPISGEWNWILTNGIRAWFETPEVLELQFYKFISHFRWWKELDCAINYPFARDRLVECYFWILAMHFEPQYELARRFTTKIISITSILDDIYDVYGTIDELLLLTDAIERYIFMHTFFFFKIILLRIMYYVMEKKYICIYKRDVQYLI